jgi:SAM-dependent methyltransferase
VSATGVGGKEFAWGNVSVPEAELGGGPAYVSAWLARRGARPVGIDNSPAQVATARRMQEAFGLPCPLHLGNAEQTPFPDAGFDLAGSESGAAIGCDPYRWVPEVARLLRPGGQLVFLVNGTLLPLCTPEDARVDTPATERLERPDFGRHRVEWPATESVNVSLGYGDWIRLLRAHGLAVEDLIEVRPPVGATPISRS